MIDTTKPMQLSDGTPVVLHRSTTSGEIWVKTPDPDKMVAGQCGPLVFNRQGRRFRYYGNLDGITLQNVPETPALDLTKPLCFRGDEDTALVHVGTLPNGYQVFTYADGSGTQTFTRKPDGSSRFGRDNPDVINTPPKPVIETRFVNIERSGFHNFPPIGPKSASAFVRTSDVPFPWDYATLKLTLTDGQLTGAEVVRG